MNPSYRRLETLEDIQIPLPAHPRRAQQVFDDENGNLMVSGNDERARNARFGVNEMVASLAIEREAVSLKNRRQR